MATVRIDGKQITDWSSFHQVFKEACGFPEFYGMNMNAWIDCLSDLREDYGMSRFKLASDELLHIEVYAARDLNERLPDIVNGLVECSACVNARYATVSRSVSNAQAPALALVFVG